MSYRALPVSLLSVVGSACRTSVRPLPETAVCNGGYEGVMATTVSPALVSARTALQNGRDNARREHKCLRSEATNKSTISERQHSNVVALGVDADAAACQTAATDA